LTGGVVVKEVTLDNEPKSFFDRAPTSTFSATSDDQLPRTE